MFNHYFFHGAKSRKVFKGFLKKATGNGVALVMDPPFGGRVEPLARTCQLFGKIHRKICGDSDKFVG